MHVLGITNNKDSIPLTFHYLCRRKKPLWPRLNSKTVLMKKLLLLLATTSAMGQTIGFVVPNYTLSQHLAPGCRVDSTIVTPNSANVDERIVYAYDAGNRMVYKDRIQYTTNQREVNTWTYDVNDSLVQKTYASGSGVPSGTMLTRYTRNAANAIATDTILYSTGGPFAPNTVGDYVYDGSGRITEVTRRIYSTSWNNMNRLQYTYNGSGQLINTLFQGWNNGWQNSVNTDFTYDGNGQITEVLSQNWNVSQSAWVNGNRTQYVYTGTHLDTLTRSNGSTGTWKDVYRFIYGPSGATDTVTYEFWNISQWEGFERYIRTWNQGRMTSVVIEEWHSANWEKVWKHDYNINSQGNHVATDLSVYSGTSWVLLIPTVHHVTCHSTVGLAAHTNSTAKVFPVPAEGEVWFSTASPVMHGALLNIQGETVTRFEGDKTDLTALPTGIYFARLELADGSTATGKVIRE